MSTLDSLSMRVRAGSVFLARVPLLQSVACRDLAAR